MIQYSYDGERVISCAAAGDCFRLCAEIGLMISLFYNATYDMDADAAERFKTVLRGVVNGQEVWKREQLPLPHVGAVFWQPAADGEGERHE